MKTSLSSSSTRTPARSSGFTVIEVLVALVILLIGGLAIMNLFPPALNVIKGSENREVAMAQVKGTLARYSSDPASIPDAIYNYDYRSVNFTAGKNYNPYGYADTAALDVAVAGTRNRNNSLPKTLSDTDFDLSALGNFKRIVGEKHKVLTTGGVNPDYFVLTNYPIATEIDGSSNPLPPRVYVMDNVEGARIDKNGQLDFTDAKIARTGESVSDPAAPAKLATQWQSGCIYYVSYRWQNGVNEPFQGVIDEPCTPASFNYQVFQGRLTPQKFIVPGGVDLKVYREYTSQLPVSGNPSNLSRGFLLLKTTPNSGPAGIPVEAGQEVSINYTVRDWRWIVNDSAPTQSVVRVPMSTIDSTNPVYSILSSAPDASYTVGVPITDTWTKPTAPAWIDYRRGDIDYSKVTPAVTVPTAARSRVVYRTDAKWAQQLSVAAQSYYPYDSRREVTATPVASSEDERERWHEYFWDPTPKSSYPAYLYFRSSEAGKTVMVTYSRLIPGSTPPNTEVVQGQITTIAEKLQDIPTPLASQIWTESNRVSVGTLLDANGEAELNVTAILAVRGVSVRARTAWQQGSDYTQEVAEMYRPLN